MINPEWLRYFVVLTETLSFHAAAEQLHVTPQAVSNAIAGLEAHYKVRLVERDRRVRGLTSAGEALLDDAQALLQGFENVDRRMAEWNDRTPHGVVTVASVGLCQNFLLPRLLADLLERYPRIRPRLHQMLPRDVEIWVASGEVDLGMLLQPPARADLEWAAGISSPYVIVGKPGPTPEKRDWRDFGYIVPRIFRRDLAEPLDGWPPAIKRRIVVETDLLDTALNLCEAGVGASFVPELAARERLRQGSLAVVADPPCEFHDQLYLIWRKGVRQTRASRAMFDVLQGLVAP